MLNLGAYRAPREGPAKSLRAPTRSNWLGLQPHLRDTLKPSGERQPSWRLPDEGRV